MKAWKEGKVKKDEREREREKKNENRLRHRRRRYILREDLVSGKLIIRLFDEIISFLAKKLLDGQPQISQGLICLIKM